ncbi:hypothetical protein HPB50_000881 [Hyalomma asiaticum]|uniref:Uncharacterized protein n=1 Tax=Hyalomma asiaticum TaxID=266040 RepID=A0ACB7SA41_HYAAI|nr:hypothetical protein HPB50_000881 [Hyalomma asiaticum]
MSKPVKRQTHCFAPGCSTGYVSARKASVKKSVFAVPSSEDRLKEWRRAVPRADKILDQTSVLCESHFEERFILRDYTHIVNGEVVKIPHGRPCLTEDAIPTIFPNTPSYLSKKLPQKRHSRTSRGEVLGKKRKTNDENEPPMEHDSALDATADGAPVIGACTVERLDYLQGEMLPNKYWCRCLLVDAPKAVAFTVCSQAGDSLSFQKLVLCSAEDTRYHCSVFVQGVTVKKVEVFDAESVKSLLHSVNEMIVCSGFEQSAVPLEQRQSATLSKHRMHGNKFHSKRCSGVSQDQRPCIHCRYLKKLLLNQASYKKRKARVATGRRTSKQLTIKRGRQLRRQKAKVSRLETILAKMKKANSTLSESNLQKSLSELPEKQRQQVQTCFDAAKRKGTQGMKYSDEWLLDCIIMRIKSPKLYEHIRKHKIMVLPSKSCLNKYVKNYKSNFGFNENVFTAIAEKTKCMDEFQRHGGILIDEMKLSESLKVTSSGFIEGFVDLGKYTPLDQSTQTCDHGLVVLYQPFSGNFSQILGVFGSHGNVKGDMLAKIITDATLAAEKSGLYVDFVTTDGASWNRSMWRQFGIKGTSKSVVCKVSTLQITPEVCTFYQTSRIS